MLDVKYALHAWRDNGSMNFIENNYGNNSKNTNTNRQKQKRQVERLDKLLPLPISVPYMDAISNFSLSMDENQMEAECWTVLSCSFVYFPIFRWNFRLYLFVDSAVDRERKSLFSKYRDMYTTAPVCFDKAAVCILIRIKWICFGQANWDLTSSTKAI